MKKPNFLIVGAAKCGTTSLYHYLKQHSEIFMPENFKEPQFFVRKKISGRLHKYIYDNVEYYNLFKNAKEQCIGEASVFYLFFYKEAIKNILQELGSKIKIIIMLRNPVDRTISAYQHVYRNNIDEKLSLKLALAQESTRLKENPNISPMVMYTKMSMYSKAVEAYLNAFSNVHIIFYDDFKKNSKKCVDEICNFLELKTDSKINYTFKYNQGGWHWRSNLIKKIFIKENFIKKIFKLIIPKSFRVKLYDNLKSKNISNEQINVDFKIKENLSLLFRNDILKLEKLLNKDLDSWKNVT